MMNIGNRVAQKHETDANTAGKVSGLAKVTLVGARAVAYEPEEIEPCPWFPWRDTHMGLKRTALGGNRRPRDKRVIKLKLLAFLGRSACFTVSAGSAALKLVAERKVTGTGLESRVKERDAAKVAEAAANVSKREAGHNLAQYDKR